VLKSVDAVRSNALMNKIIEAEPELLLPYVLDRMGETQRAAIGLVMRDLAAGQADGSIRQGNPRTIAQALLLVAQSFTLSGAIADDVDEADLRVELARIIDALLDA
jgi:translation elongation factor EF-G